LGGRFWRGTREFGVEPLGDGTKGKSGQEGPPFFSQLYAIAPLHTKSTLLIGGDVVRGGEVREKLFCLP
jgi:hypothetical protein